MFPPPPNQDPAQRPPPPDSPPLIQPIDTSELKFETQQALQVIPFKRTLLSTLARAQPIFIPLAATLGTTFDGTKRILPAQDWQLIVLRIGKRANAPYVFTNNVFAAEVMGMPEAKRNSFDMAPEDILAGKGPWSKRDRLILRIVDEQLATRTNSVEAIQQALKVLTEAEVVEALIIHGLYCLFAGVTRGLRVAEDSSLPGLENVVREIVTANFVIPKEG
jgi:hypothetical protein